MQILCPQCHAVYEVGPLIKNAVLICHRCQTEFSADGKPVSPDTNHAPAGESELPLFEQVAPPAEEEPSQPPAKTVATDEESEPDSPILAEAAEEPREKPDSETGTDEEHEEKEPPTVPKREVLSIAKILEEGGDDTPPSEAEASEEVPEEPMVLRRKKSSIWPWLVMILLLLGSSGFYFKQDTWLSHPWVRSLLINAHIPLPVRNEDWSIVSDSVQAQWISRQDGSRVLLIEGKVENRLYCSMNPPKILVRFFAPGSNNLQAEQTHIITEPPTVGQIRQAPYITPAKDKVPVESRGSRTFMLVIENSPKGGDHFELSPVAVER